MKIGLRLKRSFYRKIVKPNIRKVYETEYSLVDYPGAITADKNGPIRFDIPSNIITTAEKGKPNNLANRKTLLPMISCIKNIKKSYSSLKNNKNKVVSVSDEAYDGNDANHANHAFFENLGEFCADQGITSYGFVKLPHHLIFQEKAVLFDNAIVLTMEMDKERINLAPHIKTAEVVMQTYNTLGIAANKIASFIREHGFSAQASHPLGGVVLYPPLAQAAGLGWLGRHGLLITPECGPRVRLAVVFTNISNLPFSTENPHKWIPEFCEKCSKCIKKCPAKSIKNQPIIQENGLITHNDSEKCFSYFVANYGCSICIKVCPFSTTGYEKIKKITKMWNEKSQ